MTKQSEKPRHPMTEKIQQSDMNFQQSPMPPTTTLQQDVVAAGQRRINIIWESTQATVAVMITGAVIYCSINKIDAEMLNNSFFLIVSMYFVRTNHSLIGGVGQKPDPYRQDYAGR